MFLLLWRGRGSKAGNVVAGPHTTDEKNVNVCFVFFLTWVLESQKSEAGLLFVFKKDTDNCGKGIGQERLCEVIQFREKSFGAAEKRCCGGEEEEQILHSLGLKYRSLRTAC